MDLSALELCKSEGPSQQYINIRHMMLTQQMSPAATLRQYALIDIINSLNHWSWCPPIIVVIVPHLSSYVIPVSVLAVRFCS